MKTRSLLFALLLLAGCKREEPAPGAAASAPSAKEKVKAYEVTATVASPVLKGAGGALVAKVVATEGFHVNPDYPFNFRPEGSSEHVAFEQKRYELKDAAEKTACAKSPADTCELKATVPFTTSTSGSARVAGVLAFSVCDPNQCLIEKVPVSAAVTVD